KNINTIAERNVGSGVKFGNRVDVLLAAVSLICRYFADSERLGSLSYQRFQEWAVTRALFANLDSSDNVRLCSADHVRFNPICLLAHPLIFVVVPTMEAASAETSGINGKLNFHTGKRQAALPNQITQDRRQSVIFKVIENGVVVRN